MTPTSPPRQQAPFRIITTSVVFLILLALSSSFTVVQANDLWTRVGNLLQRRQSTPPPFHHQSSSHKYHKNNHNNNNNNNNMGQAVRMMKYNRADNERNAIGALNFLDQTLKWHRLDDGVMGGQSETNHVCSSQTGSLHFQGTINTNGGGFCSIRAPFEGFAQGTTGLKIQYKGDGKTYKLTLSDGGKSTFGPSRSSPSWQADIQTQAGGKTETVTIPFSTLKPSWGPRSQPTHAETEKLDASTIRQLGFMISLKLSDGSPNPKETFGEGIFPFSLEIESIEPVEKK